MKILCDFHHSSLYSSYLYTLEARLGHEVYRCIGREWFEKGYWKINRQEDTIQQYLGTVGYKPADGTPQLNDVMWVKDSVYYSRDPNTQQIHKAITYKTFLDMDFDVIIASIPTHIEPFKKLAKLKGAKFILQVGNEWNIPYDKIDNLMASVAKRQVPCHSVFYHQEFDTNAFSYGETKKAYDVEMKPSGKANGTVKLVKKERLPDNLEIHTYMNALKNYPEAYDYFLELEKEMPDYTFKMYGGQNRDGSIQGAKNLAHSMKQARWIFHIKPGGDGYGHVLFNTYAVGRPIITNKRHYEGKLGGQMMDDKSTIIMDGLKPSELAVILRNREEINEQMSLESYKRFTDNVDFEKEAKEIQKFLEELE